MPFLKTKTRKLFRLYRKNYDFEKYRTSIILKMRHRFDVALPTKAYKYYRKMPFIFKRKIRKKKRRTKLKSASKIRYFRKRSKAFEIWEPIKQKKFLPLIFKKNISVYKYAKY